MDIGRVRGIANRVSFRFSRPGTIPIPGANRSSLRGHGLSFLGYREYQYGDDIRSVDWNVAARHTRPVVKLFEQEHASAFVLVLDASASMRSPDADKWELARELAVLFAFVAARDAESVGAVVVTSRVETEFRPRRGLAHADALARWLDAFRPVDHQTALGNGIDRALQILRHPGVVVIASDFLSPDWDRAARRASRRHTVIGLSLVSPREQELPDGGLIEVQDVESRAKRWIDSHAPVVRRAYAASAESVRQAVRTRLRDAGVIPVEIHTRGHYLRQLRGICRVRPR